MKRKVLVQLVLPLMGLCILFWLLAFPTDSARRQPDWIEMSVILRSAEGASATLRQGMEQAAEDLRAEVRFLTPVAGNDAAEQAALLAREVEGNAAAVLLQPADRQGLADAVADAAGSTVLVTLETDMTQQGAAASVSVDHALLGEALGRAAVNGVRPGGTVVLLDSVPGDNGIRQRLTAAEQFLREAGRTVRTVPWTGDGSGLLEILEQEQAGAVVALEAGALEAAAELSRSGEQFPLLYGAGSTAAIAAGLERGRITSIAAENDFSAGYLAVAAAVSAVRGEVLTEIPDISFSMIRKETMYDDSNQKLLFPVT